MESLYKLFESIHPMTEIFWHELRILVKRKEYPKKTLLLTEGNICREIHFLISGSARAYYLKNGEEITCWLMKENDLIISVQSFFCQLPSRENIELLEDSKLVSLNYDSLQHLYEKYPSFNFIGRVLTERYYLPKFSTGFIHYT